MDVMHLLTPNQLQVTQAVYLFITTQGTATIEGTALGDDDQTPQARCTQAIWVNATANTEIPRLPQPGVDSCPLYPGLRQNGPHADGLADTVGR